MDQEFDRAAEDFGNIAGLEHVNVEVPEQGPASDFYLLGLGFTRDPYMFPGTNNMWVNIGRNQFHLPKGDPLVVRGHVGIVTPDREALLNRLANVKTMLEGSKFAFKEHNDHVEATCPWGNKLRLHEPDVERFGAINLGIPYVEFDVPLGTAAGIVRFYDEILGAPTKLEGNGSGKVARITVGLKQELVFRETDAKLPEFDGHHIQIYVQDFAGPHAKLAERGLITEESDRCQYRFQDIVDLDSGKPLFTIEHEVRSLTHPLYARPLVNRNPSQSNRTYSLGADSWVWTLPQSLVRPAKLAPATVSSTASALVKRRARRNAQQEQQQA
jgi:hypothetical protein